MADKANRFATLFVVVDPTRMIQPALIKGEWIAKREGAQIHLYCCIYDEELAANKYQQDVEHELTQAWLERMASATRDAGLEVTIELEWNSNWRRALVEAAARKKDSLLIKTASRHSAIGRRLMATSDWMLLAEATCPILLVVGARPWENKKLLAAIKLKPEDEPHERLNEQILTLSRDIAKDAGLEMYAVTAAKGEDVYFDRQAFANRCGLPRNRVHSVSGNPAQGIAKIAREMGADVIIIGNPGESATARRLIDQVHTDVLVLPDVDISASDA